MVEKVELNIRINYFDGSERTDKHEIWVLEAGLSFYARVMGSLVAMTYQLF